MACSENVEKQDGSTKQKFARIVEFPTMSNSDSDSETTNLGHDGGLAYNEEDAARALCISKRTLQKLRKTNRITAVRINSRVVYEREELRAYLKRNRTS